MDDDYDIPSADPAIRIDYESALGRFILAYNEVDYRLSQVIQRDLSERKRDDLAKSALEGSFNRRLDTLDLLAQSPSKGMLRSVPITRLRELNADRNKLAHGHFDQNPFDGSYSVVQAAKARDYPVAIVLAFAGELTEIADLLRLIDNSYDFDFVTEKGP